MQVRAERLMVFCAEPGGGTVASPQPGVLVIASAQADPVISGPAIKLTEEGVYVGDRRNPTSKFDVKRDGDACELRIDQPKAIRLAFRPLATPNGGLQSLPKTLGRTSVP